MESVEDAIDNLAGCGDRWAQLALESMGEVEFSRIRSPQRLQYSTFAGSVEINIQDASTHEYYSSFSFLHVNTINNE